MKPCSKNRKRIAWLALDALDASQAAALRDHLALCEGCRRYAEEMSNTVRALTATAEGSEPEASASFHRRVAERLEAAESPSVLESLHRWLGGSMLNWRVALPAIAVLGIVLVALVTSREPPADSPLAQPAVQVASSSRDDLAPTLANYQMIACQSLDKLDELLTRQGNKSLPPAPV